MRLIATHDSATGERPTWWSAPLTIFARTQDKCLGDQVEAGCTLFDLRVKKVFGVWRCAHGWWFTRRTFKSIMDELDFYAGGGRVIRVLMTYEGREKNAAEFVRQAMGIRRQYPAVRYGPVCAKYGRDAKGLKVKYSEPLIPEDEGWCPYHTEQAFLALDGHSWHTYIPIPRLWKRFFFRRVDFSDRTYRFVDFL